MSQIDTITIVAAPFRDYHEKLRDGYFCSDRAGATPRQGEEWEQGNLFLLNLPSLINILIVIGK